MEGVLLSAVVVLAVLVLLDLALTLAVIRRLRQQADHGVGPVDPNLQRMVGRAVPNVSTVAIDGTQVTAAWLGDAGFVAFVATGCGACHDDLPYLRAHLEQLRSAGVGTLVVVVDSGDGDDDELVTALGNVAPVVVEAHGEGERPLLRGFEVDGFPTYIEVGGGTVAQVHMSMALAATPATPIP